MRDTSGAAAASRSWVMTRGWSAGSPLTNTLPSRVSMTAARGEFCPAVTACPAVIGPVRFSIAVFMGMGRSAHWMRFSTVVVPRMMARTAPEGRPRGRGRQ